MGTWIRLTRLTACCTKGPPIWYSAPCIQHICGLPLPVIPYTVLFHLFPPHYVWTVRYLLPLSHFIFIVIIASLYTGQNNLLPHMLDFDCVIFSQCSLIHNQVATGGINMNCLFTVLILCVCVCVFQRGERATNLKDQIARWTFCLSDTLQGTMLTILAAGSVFFPGLFLLSKQCLKSIPALRWSEGDAVIVSARWDFIKLGFWFVFGLSCEHLVDTKILCGLQKILVLFNGATVLLCVTYTVESLSTH